MLVYNIICRHIMLDIRFRFDNNWLEVKTAKVEYEFFTLKNRSEVEQFENLLTQYVAQKAQFSPSHISLVAAYDALQEQENGGKIFTALLDIQINFMLLYCDIHNVGVVWNNSFSKGKLEGGSVLDSPEKFMGKMDIHRFNSSFVLRYRALWDKLMGLMILLLAPDNYESFMKAKSRKKAFRKIISEAPGFSKESFDSLLGTLTKFDDAFRTSEAHGTGILRKYSFTMEDMHKNPQIELIGYWNIVNEFISRVGAMFKKHPVDKTN